jgi:hypothetical protein
MKHLYKFLIISVVSFLSCKEDRQEFISVNGKMQRTLDIGDGEPTVVFVTGLGDDLSVFDSIQSEISKTNRTISYDRAGIGDSEPIDNPRTVDNLAYELNEIITKKKLKRVVLIGHSLGGHIVRYYCNTYTDKIDGALLIDPGYEHFLKFVKETRTENEKIQIDSLLNAYYSTTSIGVQNEFKSLSETESMMNNIGMPINIPVTIITSSKYLGDDKEWPLNENDKRMWVELHKKWVIDNNNIKQVITDKSGHYIYVEEPELVINEIKILLTKLKERNK